jgi:hypothetical protein
MIVATPVLLTTFKAVADWCEFSSPILLIAELMRRKLLDTEYGLKDLVTAGA